MRVDFLSNSLLNGAVGVFKDGFNWISREDGSFSTTSTEIAIVKDNREMLYPTSNISILFNDVLNVTEIRVGGDLMVTILHEYGGKLYTL